LTAATAKRNGSVLDRGRRSAIGAHAERSGPFDLEKIGHAVELSGNIGVVDAHPTNVAANRSPSCHDLLVGAPRVDLDQGRNRHILYGAMTDQGSEPGPVCV
jgi:hypothetical protein